MKNHHRFWGILWVVFLLDQASKFFAQKYGLVLINSGISFSFFDSWSGFWFMIGPILLSVLVWSVMSNRALGFAEGLLFGGGLSNWVDRLMVGGVRDWLPLSLPGMELRNNLADWAIAAGILFLIYHEWQGRNDHKHIK